ncbi:hypothetical protein WGM54_14430 [Paenibacillus polymyxa]|uniref:hypothetical protein n=1 Tax=Paenibacillus polymyxa TaxID=1406 RepID=UPI00307EBB9A
MAIVIETNLSMVNGQIFDFQSRTIEVTSWLNYINEFTDNKSISRTAYIGSMHGATIPQSSTIKNLVHNGYTLKCDIYTYSGIHTQKLSYLVE